MLRARFRAPPGRRGPVSLSLEEYRSLIERLTSRPRLLRGDHYLRGEQRKSSKLTEADVRGVRRRRFGRGETNVQIAHIVGVSTAAVASILSGRSWCHVPLEPSYEQYGAGSVPSVPPRRRRSLRLRRGASGFWARVERSRGTKECWPYLGCRFPNGYGHVGRVIFGKRESYAHRAAWIYSFGPIPKGGPGHHGWCVLHRCDNPPCCNPDHLFIGSIEDNVRDRDQKRRGREALSR